jgi:transcription-repair coupling factor (superfamily II helicase)
VLTGLLSHLGEQIALPQLSEADLVCVSGIRPPVVALAAKTRPVLVVTATEHEAEEMVAGLRCLTDRVTTSVEYFPSWETLPHERLSPRSDTVGRRLDLLRRLHLGLRDTIIVAPVRAVLQPLVAGLGTIAPVEVRENDEISIDELSRRLVNAAYTRTDLVERRGEFAVRGGIIDVFPTTQDHPVRLEFFGDVVEEIRSFRVADQRSTELAEDGLYAPACREILLSDEVRQRAAESVELFPQIQDMLERIAEGQAVDGMEALAPLLVDRMELLVDLLPSDALVILSDPERIRTRSADLVATAQEFLEASWLNAAAGNSTPIDLSQAGIDLSASSYQSLATVRSHVLNSDRGWWTLTPFGLDEDESMVLPALEPERYRSETARVVADLQGWIAQGYRCVLMTEGHGPAERLVELLSSEDVPARLGEEGSPIEPGVVTIVTGSLVTGFISDQWKTVLLTETDISGQKSTTRDMRKMPSRRRNVVDPLSLKPGDYVVHEQHGIGKYIEMASREVAGATREYLVIEYAPSKRGHPGDRLYVPSDNLDLVTRYVGGEMPSVHRLGGADWEKAKGRARKAVREIAGELIRLYAARTSAPGYAFSPDTPWQRELEDAFEYVETPDQLATINEVKADMEKSYPMDRIVCGDVGYGKTEIAIRAAFKAVQDGKQVAILVPTTLLVQQHFATFSERYSGFPVKLAALSRFQSAKESAAVLAGLAEGSIDVVIGTHRLLSSEVQFKDLGLVVVDEEQRFGVEHKEFLKQMRVAVDVLSMSATPIPRTLEMAITGIREMSTITTPPEDRHPVLTYVGAYDERNVVAAIRRELLRDGQVFFVHNRVESIEKAAARIRELVPEARIEVAHGQMNEDALEQVIVGFWEKQFDVLVCTTIIESGIDIANANTLIVERSDLFGLSQLHQLRGRVGRGRERAYSYFLFPPDKPLTDTAHDRLATIAAHTDLGSGMQVAMKDLEIRGAGNLLGGEQSGHIADVGFDLYIRLVGEAVAQYKGEPIHDSECKIELPIDAHIPHTYVPGERLRLEAYRRMADISSDEELAALREELLDRYGALPEPVENLLMVASFRAKARALGLKEIAAQGPHVRFAPVDLPESAELRVKRLYPNALMKRQVRTILVPRPTPGFGSAPLRDAALLDWCQEVLSAMYPAEGKGTL